MIHAANEAYATYKVNNNKTTTCKSCEYEAKIMGPLQLIMDYT